MESKDKKREDLQGGEGNEVREAKEEKAAFKKTFKFPLLALVPVVIIISVLVILFVFVLHSGKAAVSPSYIPVNSLSTAQVSSFLGGNWTLLYNTTENSTVIKSNPSYFPPGTIAADIEEFIPSSKVSAVHSNLTANISVFSSEVFYMNSSVSSSSVFSEVSSLLGSEYHNSTIIKFNSSTVGGSKLFYVNGVINSTALSFAYISNGKYFIIDTSHKANFSYEQAGNLAVYPFSPG